MNNGSTYPNKEVTADEFLKSDETFRQLIKNSFDMLVLLDSDGVQRYVSESCKKILGYDPRELTDISVIESMIHPDDQAKTKQGFLDIVKHSKHGGTQYRHRHKNGDWVYLEAYGNNQLHNPDIQAVVLNVRDITERKKAEKALKDSETRLSELIATKDRFFSIIGHDLKNPFSGILGFSELLIDQLKNKHYDDSLELAQMIQHSSKRVMDLLNNLLAWAQSQTGKTKFNPEYFEIDEVADEVIDLLRDSSHQKSISLTNGIPPGTLVYADKPMITLVLRNLVSNGVKFTQPGGKIDIESEKNKGEISISVIDNGVGISKDNIEDLFNVDKRHSSKGTYNETGTGLGLLLCKDFIKTHGGRIWAESELDKGSKFTFMIPQKTGC
ncbi:PAS domain-containing sensor histidine kinase [Rhodohalobacter sulfatireducens]|uniref:histidine kinase n=1 Tax=Rhodohalobacter sulfatireducens TaxID=2911366 RepID=A0ABS9KFE7_9BACT|nr:PAS domain-containing sensor histidine kinase [Rhodohalobacter sulfatireducens]MCG2589507.1 PAS domain-containing sensor histidine kinase [Rhodohalobacter sulfatireducens]